MERNLESGRDIFDEAADWWQRSREGAPEDQAALEQWLDADPRHREAFDQVKSSWAMFSDIQSEPGILERRSEAISSARSVQRRRQDALPTRRAAVGLAAAAVVAAVVVPIVYLTGGRETQTIKTGIGEQKVLALSDGSQLTIDANSHLNVRFDRKARDIEVVKGRAHFSVAKDRKRPFRVKAADNSVTAVGTAFSVELRKEVVSVALFEGRVALATTPAGKTKEVSLPEMKPGQLVRIAPQDASPQYSQVDQAQALAWQDSKLFFTDERLDDVADRLNDYSSKPILVDGNARQLLVSGMFIVGQTDSFIAGLERFYEVKVEETADAIVISPRT